MRMRLQPAVKETPRKIAGRTPTLRHWSQREPQAKLAIGSVNDVYEDEADRVAEEVLRRPLSPPASGVSPVQDGSGKVRKCGCEAGKEQPGACDQCRQQTARPKTADTAESSLNSPDVDSVVRSPGQPLGPATRTFMETRFGHDFARVRVHADEPAARSAHGIGARAYTLDQHIVFARGEFSPATTAGQRLLAHELVHTIQQPGAASRQNPANATTSEAGRSRGLALNPLHLQQASGRRVMRAVSQEVSARFGRYQIFAEDLSNRDVIQWLNDLTEEGLRKYRDRVRDPEVKKYITNMLLNQPGVWGSQYGLNPTAPRKNVPEFRATTSMSSIQSAIPAPSCISMASLKTIFPGMAKDITPADTDVKKDRAGKAKTYLKNLNDAFKIMKIDTIQAQADYLAHAFVESDQFRAMTESQKAVKDVDQQWMDDPSKVQIATGSIGRDDKGVLTPPYRPGGDINPGGSFEFLGRGPVQVTGRSTYLQVIAQLESVADFYFRHKDYANSQAAREAANAVRKDPKNAADPRYTFLVSAALMKYRGGDRRPGGPGEPIKAGDWVSGGGLAAGSTQDDKLVDKSAAYTRAFCVLLQDAKAENTELKVPKNIDKGCSSYPAGAACGSAKKP